ncbi:MAG: protein kinase [Gemmatimonadota bacterium]
MPEAFKTLTAALADRYRLERELGQGGMATVYLAEDLKHGRKVAIKVLRPELGMVLGAERFLSEIRITAGLEHPHILTLIDSGEAEGLLFYVLPYIRGESLRQKLTRETQLSLDETLAITQQVAGALDHAHQKGIIHRDLKPENILLHEGEAMLADFGIALAVKEAGGNRLTETGLSLGTPQYMSPEQATGDRQLTPRSDVYSLSAVVYEMLAGEPPVTGPSAHAMIAKLMTERPVSLHVVRNSVPDEVDLVVQRGLAKIAADRFATAGELSRALGQAAASRTIPLKTGTGSPTGRWPRWASWAAVVLLLTVAIAAARLFSRAAPQLSLGRSEQFTADPGLEIQPAISPDGKLIAYSAGNTRRMRVYLRPAGGGRTIPLSDDSTSVETHPRWSPDGSSLLFLTRGGVSVAPALGGSSRAVVPASSAMGGTSAVLLPVSVASAVWSPNGMEIAFARGDSLQVVPAAGGTARLLGTGVYDLHSCDWSPNGKWIACVAGNSESVFPGEGFGNIAPSTVVLFPAAGGAPIRLLEARLFGQSPIWTHDGSVLLFISNRDGPRDIYALSVTSSGELRGEPTRLTTGLGAISLSMSADGHRLAYAVYTAQANLWSLPVSGATAATPRTATQVTSSHQVIESVRVSADGRWLLYDSDLKGNADLYRIPIEGGQPEQLTSDSVDEFAPALSPDGKSVAYHTFRRGTRDIEVKPLNGGVVETAVIGPGQESFPVWSPDGQAMAFWDQLAPYTISMVRRGPGGRWLTPEHLVTPGLFPEWSPDGKLIGYVTDLPSMPSRLCVIGPAGGTQRCLLEPGPGVQSADRVQWSPDSRTLYYKAHDAAGRTSFWSISAGGGAPHRLIQFDDPDWQSYRPFFATDGKRFFFPVEDRESDVFVADLGARKRP